MIALSRPPSADTSRRRANELLALPHMRLHLILAILCCLTFWIGGIYLSERTFNAVPWASLYEGNRLLYTLLDVVYYVVDGLIILFLGLPLLYGCAMILEGAARGVREPMTTLFCAFESPRRYRKTLGLMLRFIGAHALPVALCAWLIWARYQTDGPDTLWETLPTTLVFLFVASIVLGRNDAVLTLAYDDPTASVRDVFARSRTLTKGRLWGLFRFKSSFVGWALLSVLTLGLVLIFHALPHFSLSYSLYLTADRDNTPHNLENHLRKDGLSP